MTWGIFKTDSVSDTVKKLQETNITAQEVKEEVEQIDEIGDTPAGRKKLGNYVKKASVAATGHAQEYEGSKEYPGDDELGDSGNEKHYRKMDNRLTGIHRAINKLTKEEVEEIEFSLFNETELDMLISEANNANMTAGAWINDFLHAQQRLMASKGMGGKDAKALALAAYYNHQQAKGKKPAIEEGRMNLDAKEIKHINLKDTRNDAEIMEPRAQGEKAFVAQHTLIVTDEPNKDGTPNGADKLSATKGPKGQGAGKYDAKEKLGNQGITSKKGEFSEETCSTGPTATGDKAGEIVDTTPQEKKSANKKTYGKFKQEIGHEIK